MDIKLRLYYSRYCIFCQRVMMYLRGKDHGIELKSTSEADNATALMKGGGKTQVPCLLIEKADEAPVWMYESGDIVDYLRAQSII